MSGHTPKLHEVLLLERSAKQASTRAMSQFSKLISRTQDMTGTIVEKSQLREAGNVNSGIDDYIVDQERRPSAPLLQDEFARVMDAAMNWLNFSLTKKETNANNVIVGNLVIDGVDLGPLSGTTLLGIEHHYKQLRELLRQVPRLPAGDGNHWQYNEAYKMYTSAAITEPISEMREGTAVIVGYRRTIKLSAKMPSDLAKLYMQRINNIINSAARARNEANRHDAIWCGVGARLHQYVLQGTL